MQGPQITSVSEEAERSKEKALVTVFIGRCVGSKAGQGNQLRTGWFE